MAKNLAKEQAATGNICAFRFLDSSHDLMPKIWMEYFWKKEKTQKLSKHVRNDENFDYVLARKL
jgi:hypothetical protein